MSEEMQGRSRRKKEGEDQPFSLKKEIISWLQIIVAAVVIALVLNNFVIANRIRRWMSPIWQSPWKALMALIRCRKAVILCWGTIETIPETPDSGRINT